MSGTHRRTVAVVVALLVAAVIGYARAGAAAPALGSGTPVPAKSVEWTRYDVDLDLRSDGVLHVVERQAVAFHGGPFASGFATIPLRNLAGIDGVAVGEAAAGGAVVPYTPVPADAATGTPGTYRVQVAAAEVRVDWWFPATTDAARTFVLAFDARGALREMVEDGAPYQEVWWIAVSAEVTTTAPVRAARVTLRLPAPVDPARVLVSPTGFVPAAPGAPAAWTWERTDLAAGEEVAVRLRFPALVRSAPPATPGA